MTGSGDMRFRLRNEYISMQHLNWRTAVVNLPARTITPVIAVTTQGTIWRPSSLPMSAPHNQLTPVAGKQL